MHTREIKGDRRSVMGSLKGWLPYILCQPESYRIKLSPERPHKRATNSRPALWVPCRVNKENEKGGK